MDKTYFVYIMASKPKGATYIGVTSDLNRRVYEHRQGLIGGYTKRFHIKKLVYYETYNEVILAIEREKKLKKWRRNWKLALIEAHNPQWNDLYLDLNK